MKFVAKARTVSLIAIVSFLLGAVLTYAILRRVDWTAGETAQSVPLVTTGATDPVAVEATVTSEADSGPAEVVATDGMETVADSDPVAVEATMTSEADLDLTESVDEADLPAPGDSAGLKPIEVIGFGILGDSNSDEYRADDDRGGDYAATTLSWVEQLVSSRGLNFGPWGAWGEPRRTGYEYNWSRTAATIQSAISSGQHTGLAEQVAAGKISHVFIYIGGNDFNLSNGTYKAIYSGEMDDAALEAKIEGIVVSITTAVDTILSAGDVKILIVPITDPLSVMDAASFAKFSDPLRRQRVTDAIKRANVGLAEMAATRPVALVDLDGVMAYLTSQISEDGFMEIGGVQINVLERGNQPHYSRLGDRPGHPGTVASALFANLFFIEPFNQHFGLGIEPLSDEEILANAGIR